MRTIDADALKEELELEYKIEYENYFRMDNDGKMRLDTVEEVIDASPTIPEWYAVNEKLPEEEGWYLATAVCGKRKVITIGAYYWADGNWDIEKTDKDLTVACWSELPEEDDNESIT